MSRHSITSRQNERVKQAAHLRDARQRSRQGRFVIDGVREIGRALDAEIEIVEAFVCLSLCTSPEATALASRLDVCSPVVAEVTPEVFEKLAFGGRSDGVVAVGVTPTRSIEALTLPPNPLIAVLEGLEKPGNVGAILRSADGAGVDAVLVTDPETDLFNPNTIRASVGTVFSLPVCIVSTDTALARLRQWQVTLVATRPDAQRLYTDLDYRGGTAIILGSEATGLSAAWQQADITGVRLPMCGKADSLNVSTTAAVLFYEALRQRKVESQESRV